MFADNRYRSTTQSVWFGTPSGATTTSTILVPHWLTGANVRTEPEEPPETPELRRWRIALERTLAAVAASVRLALALPERPPVVRVRRSARARVAALSGAWRVRGPPVLV